MKGLQGKVAIVTGGSCGIGQAIAIRLGEEGVTSLREDPASRAEASPARWRSPNASP
jgi:NAD(P)-dependent dehydrogenase (short-subunit alcohol dehydrogenase family)